MARPRLRTALLGWPHRGVGSCVGTKGLEQGASAPRSPWPLACPTGVTRASALLSLTAAGTRPSPRRPGFGTESPSSPALLCTQGPMGGGRSPSPWGPAMAQIPAPHSRGEEAWGRGQAVGAVVGAQGAWVWEAPILRAVAPGRPSQRTPAARQVGRAGRVDRQAQHTDKEAPLGRGLDQEPLGVREEGGVWEAGRPAAGPRREGPGGQARQHGGH